MELFASWGFSTILHGVVERRIMQREVGFYLCSVNLGAFCIVEANHIKLYYQM